MVLNSADAEHSSRLYKLVLSNQKSLKAFTATESTVGTEREQIQEGKEIDVAWGWQMRKATQ